MASLARWWRTGRSWLAVTNSGAPQRPLRSSVMRRGFDLRQFVEGVEGGRRWHGPFQRRGTLAPVVLADLVLAEEHGVQRRDEPDYRRGEADEGTDRRHLVPQLEGVRIVDVVARHAGEAGEMHREERQVDADEGSPEMHLGPELVVLLPAHLADPVVVPGEDAEHRS